MKEGRPLASWINGFPVSCMHLEGFMSKVDLLTFWFSHFGPLLEKVPKDKTVMLGQLSLT